MASSLKFVIGSDDEQLEHDLDYKHAYDVSADNATQETTNNKSSSIITNDVDENPLLFADEYKPLCDIIAISDYYQFQKISHRIIYPLLWICDSKLIRQRSWLQIPLIGYMICITSMIIGIALSQLIIKAYELKAVDNNTQDTYNAHDVIYFLSAYVMLITILCICFLYLYYQYNIDHNLIGFAVNHYNYFVMTSAGIIGYGILYLLVHVQSEYYSDTMYDAYGCLTASSMFAISFLGIITFIKQFVFDFNFTHTSMDDEYDSDEDNQHNPLLNDDDSNYQYGSASNLDNNEFIIDNHIDDDEMILNEYKEKGALWFTISLLSQNVWHVAIGLVMIECVVYIFSGEYINLLIDWSHDSGTIIQNIWNVVVFGFLLAFITGIVQIALQMYCKSPLYQYQLKLTANNEYANYSALATSSSSNAVSSYLASLPHKEDIILFLLNWLNEINRLWSKILASAIGWSLLTPNQTNSTLTQLVTAITATSLFLFIGFIFSDYKRRIQRDIIAEIGAIKKQLKSSVNNIDEDGELMKMIVYNKQKLLFYDQLHSTYDLAFAVSVSYSWESFIAIALSEILGTQPLNRFVAHLFLTVFIGVIFCQLGLELVDLKKQRLKEAKFKKTKIKRRENKNVELQMVANKEISNKKTVRKLLDPCT